MRSLTSCQCSRGISTAGPSLAEGDAQADSSSKAFMAKFQQHVSSTLAPPHFPTDFMKKKEIKEGEPVPEKMTMNFFLPHEQLLKAAKVGDQQAASSTCTAICAEAAPL